MVGNFKFSTCQSHHVNQLITIQWL